MYAMRYFMSNCLLLGGRAQVTNLQCLILFQDVMACYIVMKPPNIFTICMHPESGQPHFVLLSLALPYFPWFWVTSLALCDCPLLCLTLPGFVVLSLALYYCPWLCLTVPGLSCCPRLCSTAPGFVLLS